MVATQFVSAKARNDAVRRFISVLTLIRASVSRGKEIPLDKIDEAGYGQEWRMAADCSKRQYGAIDSGPKAREARRLRERKFCQFCENSIGIHVLPTT